MQSLLAKLITHFIEIHGIEKKKRKKNERLQGKRPLKAVRNSPPSTRENQNKTCLPNHCFSCFILWDKQGAISVDITLPDCDA